eukprot:COSAG03_NODE_23441_length_280_cov_0.569061_1_plen_27_part_10
MEEVRRRVAAYDRPREQQHCNNSELAH